MITSENLLEIRQLNGLSQAEMARKLRISRELLNKMEKGKFPVSRRTAERINEFMQEGFSAQISHDVNVLGKASHFPNSHIQSYHQQRLSSKNKPAMMEVPLVAIKAQAGYINSYEQVDYIDSLEQYSLPPGVNPAGAIWRYFEIDGDSMEPTLYAGDLVLATMVPAEDWNDLQNLSVYILHTTDQLLVKRVYRKNEQEWVLISDNNDAYPPITIENQSVIQVWRFRRHIRSTLPVPSELSEFS